MTRPLYTYTVSPSLPPELGRLKDLAFNLFWVWDHELLAMFMRIDPDLWEETQHNPVRMLGSLNQHRMNTLARDDSFLAQLERNWERFNEYLDTGKSWFRKKYPESSNALIAYFSAEFGITECLPNYSGGLGILSGDHLKSASDLGIPLIGAGLLYQQGYFRQYLNADGWQQERYPDNDFYTMPIQLERKADGAPCTVAVEYPGRKVVAQIWRVDVGRVKLYLLDTNIDANSSEDQDITDQLYGGDRELRIKQEMMLGIGGYRALRSLGYAPAVCHINEGHSGFLTLERCREVMAAQHLSFAEAREATKAGNIFTTHTPVPAGNDYFSPELMEKYFASYYKELKLSRKDFLGLGRQNPENESEDFCMTVLAFRMSGHNNGVSRLHGVVSRTMWQNVWRDFPVEEIPIDAITNGVHGPSWISRDMAGLFDRYLGPRWREDPGDFATWSRVHHIPDEELWRTHERRRERLVAFARSRLFEQLKARGAPPSEVTQAQEVLNPEALTIGFARRFATYKRASLILRNLERVIRILSDKERPVQIIFAGKAHPHDNPGKEIIRQIVHNERLPELRRRMVFIEDYDMVVARYLVQGVDVWLNTPRRPLEASGTSGMKASFNGALNLSILDGWWAEAYNANTGWAIGRGEEYSDQEYQDEVESAALYDLLEKEIVPLFYTRGADGLPRGWISRMKMSMRALCPEFNTNRMIREYTEKTYLRAISQHANLVSDGMKRAKALASWKETVRQAWPEVRIAEVRTDEGDVLEVGRSMQVHAWITLGKLSAGDLSVELYQGALDTKGDLVHPRAVQMSPTDQTRRSSQEFIGTISFEASGRHGYTVRVLPKHPDMDEWSKLGLILWAS